jgi:RNA polymerase sigma factor (sigma-70 family)
VEASALTHPAADGLRGPTPLLRLQSDERLVALTRRGHQAAYEALVARYQARLLAFCRHMLGSREDAEDVLQEVFAAAFNAMMADDRALNVRPWLYRIARNRSLNHLRRATAIGVDSMDVHLSEHGQSAADKVHRREEFRLLVQDVQELAETQRTALLLREIDALSYEQIAEAMETTIPSVKSLLVRARVSLAEAAEARTLTCAEVRGELGAVAEGLARTTAPVRRHLRSCDRCSAFRKQLRNTNKALAAVFPVGPLLLFKKVVLAHLGTTASAGGGAAAAGAAGASAGAGAGAGGLVSAGVGAVASKAAAGLAAAAIVTAGAVEVDHATHHRQRAATPVASAVAPRVVAAAPAAPRVVASEPQAPSVDPPAPRAAATPKLAKTEAPTATTPKPGVPPADPAKPTAPATPAATAAPAAPEQGSSTAVVPQQQPANSSTPSNPSGPDEAAASSPPPSDPPPADAAPTADPAPADAAPAPADPAAAPAADAPAP